MQWSIQGDRGPKLLPPTFVGPHLKLVINIYWVSKIHPYIHKKKKHQTQVLQMVEVWKQNSRKATLWPPFQWYHIWYAVELWWCYNSTTHATVSKMNLIWSWTRRITGITSSPYKNKHHLQSDESDWHPSPLFLSQLFLRWTLWKCGNLHKPTDFSLFREEYQELCWWAQMQ